MTNTQSITNLFHSDVRSFSVYDCERSIANGIDGFKPSMRKIIYGMNKKFSIGEVKVSIAASGIQEVSCYHHGSLEGTVVNMAQSFTGSNNAPYLNDIGQFGSRISPTASASRYIFVSLSDVFRSVFLSDDDKILEYQTDDGMLVEPTFYLPIIPTILLNGSNGMGTGFASKILNYNPIDIIRCCLDVLNGKPISDITPWYRGYRGTIHRNNNQTIFTGTYEIINSTTLKISELPIGNFTQKYREVLNDLESNNVIKNYIDNSCEEYTEFIIKCPRELLTLDHATILKTFKLTNIETENYTVWNQNGKLQKFNNVSEFITWFVNYRITRYDDRKRVLLEEYESKYQKLTEKKRFINFYLDNIETFTNNSKKALTKILESNGFTNIDDLLAIRIYSLTADEVLLLDKMISDLDVLIKKTRDMSTKLMYNKDLNAALKYFGASGKFDKG